MDYSPPGFSVHRILEAGIMEWVAIPFSGDLPDPGIEHRSPALQADALTSEPPGNAVSWVLLLSPRDRQGFLKLKEVNYLSKIKPLVNGRDRI